MTARSLPLGALAALLAVALGAFGAHGLEGRVDAERLGWWQTGVLYHLVHALALVAVGVLQRIGLPCGRSALCFGLGIALFSGSLYAMALGASSKLGMLAPLGGLSYMVGWALLARATWSASSSPGRDGV